MLDRGTEETRKERMNKSTYVFGNATSLPSKTVNYFAEGVCVMQPALRALKLRTKHGDVLVSPDGAQNVPLITPAEVSKR